MPDRRSFTVQWSETGFKNGTYKIKMSKDPKKPGPGPQSAAKKAAKQIFAALPKSDSRTSLKFQLRETTRGSGESEGTFYIGKKVKLAKPVTIKIKGETITFSYTYDAVPSAGK